jgi:hypothetical protein
MAGAVEAQNQLLSHDITGGSMPTIVIDVDAPCTIRESEGVLERAPRATHDAWAQDVREMYKKKCTPDWPVLVKKTEDQILSAARSGENGVTIVDLPKHAPIAKLVKLLSDAHPSMSFTYSYSTEYKIYGIQWE